MTSVAARSSAPDAAAAAADSGRARRRPWRNPWRHPWFLEGFTWLYLIWSLAPIAIAVLFSFNKGKSQAS
jgi:spermidine/putrescine transport system permease protein